MEQIRSFIAIELPDELKRGLYRLQDQLKTENPPRVKWVDPNSIHLTLKFLGNIAVDRTGEITGAMEAAARQTYLFNLTVKGLGVFPNLRRVQVVWVGIEGEIDKLSQLQQQIESNLARLGFAAESRPFKAHLTLARIREQASPAERQRLGQLITDATFDETYTIKVAAISLMKSQLTRQGAIYNRIGTVELKS